MGVISSTEKERHILRLSPCITPCVLICITGCGSIGSTNQTATAVQVVQQADQSKINHIPITMLNDSFLDQEIPSPYAGEVVQIVGEVVAFALIVDNQYTVTIRDNNIDVICVFDASLSNQLGDGRPVRNGVTMTIQGQCYSSGLFSSNPFTLDGCRIVTE